MKIFRLTALLIFGLVLFSCGDDEEPKQEDKKYKEISIVTGLYLYDVQGIAIGKLGNPNHKHKDELLVYPIPATKVFTVGSFDTEIEIEKIYLIKASCHTDTSEMDLIAASENIEYSNEVLTSNSVFETVSNDEYININLENLDPGFYRLFCRMNNGDLYWYNTYIDPTLTFFEDYDFYDENCP